LPACETTASVEFESRELIYAEMGATGHAERLARELEL
jgi:hypothetical protein